jgi:hypothetical protein
MKTYEAIIDGESFKWIGDRPATNGPTHVQVRIELISQDGTPNGALLAQMAREFVARTGGITTIPDPVAWQREIREDRSLPGRE